MILSKVNKFNIGYNITQPQANTHLSYLGFSSVNTDLLKGEILKNQQSSDKQKNDIVFTEEEMRRYTESQKQEYNPNNPFYYNNGQNLYGQQGQFNSGLFKGNLANQIKK
jgi:hypothetical protein